MARISDAKKTVLHRRQHRSGNDMGAQEAELAEMKKFQGVPEDNPGGEATGRTENVKAAMNRGGARLLVICFVGIFVSYFIYGLLQEKITKRNYGDERFHYFMFLVAVQCIINAMFAKLVAKTFYHSSGIDLSLDPKAMFALLSFTYVGAMLASNTSLAFISYPTQVLGKSAKPIPVLIFGVLLSHKSYPLVKYFIVLLIVMGVALFLYNGNGQTSDNDNGEQWRLFHFIGIGELLVFISLAFDGITGAIQERLRAGYEIHALHMMYAVNVYSAVYLFAAMTVTGEVFEAVGFIQRHPLLILNLLAFALMSAIGQIFIFTTIMNFGPLTCSIFTTTRKFFTILGSVIIFGNTLLPRQWFGVVFVFIGLGLDIYFGKASKSKPKPENPPNGNTDV